jgi:hypothetical protein
MTGTIEHRGRWRLARNSLAPRHGFEPRFTAPKAAVLPLDDRGSGVERPSLSCAESGARRNLALHCPRCTATEAIYHRRNNEEWRDGSLANRCPCGHKPPASPMGGTPSSTCYAGLKCLAAAASPRWKSRNCSPRIFAPGSGRFATGQKGRYRQTTRNPTRSYCVFSPSALSSRRHSSESVISLQAALKCSIADGRFPRRASATPSWN